MSCGRMENKILSYVDGRLKESERLEMEKHLAELHHVRTARKRISRGVRLAR